MVSYNYSIDGHFKVRAKVRDIRGYVSPYAEADIFIQPREHEPDIPDEPDEPQETDSFLDILLANWPFTLVMIIVIIGFLLYITRRK